MLRIHSSFHKCLTMYFIRIMDMLYNKGRLRKDRYRHFESLEGMFYNLNKNYRINSTNNFAIDLNRLEDDFRITRFIRDPRDMIVSGYFYHKRGAEPWFRMKNPNAKYWAPINGNVPDGIKKGESYADLLQRLPIEEGLIAEIEFRKFHFESMLQWPEDERIKLFKYEEILGNEIETFRQIFDFYELSFFEKKMGLTLADLLSVKKLGGRSKHVRNASTGQWKEHFTPKVEDYFNSHYSKILDKYQY